MPIPSNKTYTKKSLDDTAEEEKQKQSTEEKEQPADEPEQPTMIEDPEKAKPDESELSVHVSKIEIFPCKKPDDESSGRAITPSTRDGALSKDDTEKP